MPDPVARNPNFFYIIITVLLAGMLAVTGCAGLSIRPVPRISPEVLKERLDKGEPVLIVDVRSARAFKAQHISGAISVPLKQIEARLDEFPRDREIIFYCT